MCQLASLNLATLRVATALCWTAKVENGSDESPVAGCNLWIRPPTPCMNQQTYNAQHTGTNRRHWCPMPTWHHGVSQVHHTAARPPPVNPSDDARGRARTWLPNPLTCHARSTAPASRVANDPLSIATAEQMTLRHCRDTRPTTNHHQAQPDPCQSLDSEPSDKDESPQC